MRASPLIVTLALVGLFVVSLVLGYAVGEVFLKPPGAPPLATQATPTPPVVAVQPSPTPVPLRTIVITPPPPTPTPPPAQAITPAPTPRPTTAAAGRILYRVQAGAFLKRENAEERVNQLKGAGFDAYILPVGELFKVYVGAFAERENADHLAEQLRAIGFETLIVRQ